MYCLILVWAFFVELQVYFKRAKWWRWNGQTFKNVPRALILLGTVLVAVVLNSYFNWNTLNSYIIIFQIFTLCGILYWKQNTANQNTGNPLYIRRHYTQPSHLALRVCPFSCVGKYVFNGMPEKTRVNTEKIQSWNISR